MRAVGLAALAIAVAAAAVPRPAGAHMIEVFGTSSRSQGMGSVGVASADDFSVLFYNPARLLEAPNTFSVEFQHAYADVGVLLMPRPAGYDPPHYADRMEPRADTLTLPPLWGVTLGSTFDFGTDVLSAGFLVFLPASGVGNQESHFTDENEQHFSNAVHFELLGARLQTQTIIAGLGMQAAHWLQVGLGFAFSTLSESATSVYTPNPVDPAEVDMNLSVDQESRLALTAGINLEFGRGVSAGFSMRDQHAFEMRGANVIQLHGLEGKEGYVTEQPMNLTLHYSPRAYSAGVAWENGAVVVAADGSYLLWSRYRNAQGEAAGFRDSFDAGTGTELEISGAKARFGLRYSRSPVPEQTGRTNYADNDRITASSGVGGDLSVLGMDVGLDVHLQLIALLERSHYKTQVSAYDLCSAEATGLCDEDDDRSGLQTGNPGFPGFTSGGYVVAGGVTLTWKFGE